MKHASKTRRCLAAVTVLAALSGVHDALSSTALACPSGAATPSFAAAYDGLRPEKAKLNHNLLEVYPPEEGSLPLVKNTYYEDEPGTERFDRLLSQSGPCAGVAPVTYFYGAGTTTIRDARG
ncbi:MAG: hypothetical protein AAFU77_17945, partial [Myxococcota bacterium]